MTKQEMQEREERLEAIRWSHRSFKIIAVDFDGCLCENAWPEIGEPLAYNIATIQHLQRTGNKIILWTCREGALLDDAVEWCKEHGIVPDAVNASIPEAVRAFGGESRKIFADEYFDDKATRMNELTNASEYRRLHPHEYNWSGKPAEKYLDAIDRTPRRIKETREEQNT